MPQDLLDLQGFGQQVAALRPVPLALVVDTSARSGMTIAIMTLHRDMMNIFFHLPLIHSNRDYLDTLPYWDMTPLLLPRMHAISTRRTMDPATLTLIKKAFPHPCLTIALITLISLVSLQAMSRMLQLSGPGTLLFSNTKTM